MNKKLISKALSGIDDHFIEESMTYEKKRKSSPERNSTMGRYENGKTGGHSRRLMALILVACLIFALAITAYAANAFGIRDMFYRELPEEVDPYIQQHKEEKQDGDLSCQINESYCDSGKVMVTLGVSGGENYILAPTDADPSSPVSVIGVAGDETLESYAKAQGKTLLFVGATLRDNEKLGISVESFKFEHPAPNEMYILVEATRAGSAEIAGEAVCRAYILDQEGNKKDITVPFTLTQAPDSDSGTFAPDHPNVIPNVTIGEATVTKEASGINIRWKADVDDQMTLANLDATIEGITQWEGGYVLEDDGWYFELYMGQGEVGDTLTVHFSDGDGNPTGDVVFTRKK